MLKLLLLSLSLCFIRGIIAQGCSASVKLVDRPGSWLQEGQEQRLIDAYITNTGTCNFAGSIKASIVFPPGVKIEYSWGYNQASQEIYSIPELTPGQTYAGIGFITAGWGDPVITILDFGACACGGVTTGGNKGQSTGDSTTGGTPAPTPAPTLPPTSTYDVNLQILVLSCDGKESTLDVAKLILDSVGATYTVVSYPIWGNVSLNLTNPDGSGKYYAIVAAVELACWSQAQVIEIEAYEIAFHAKTVILYSFPYPTNGVTSSVTAGTLTGNVTLAADMLPWATSVKKDMQVEISGVWVYPSVISNANLATPALYVNLNGDATQYVGAAFVTYNDTRRRMEFYFDQGTWGLFSALLGPTWFNWVTNGIYAGARRIELNCHADDVFMATGMYDNTLHTESEEITYRISTSDLLDIKAWTDNLVSRLPVGSSFVVTFPFNGATVIENGGYSGDPLFLQAKLLRDSFYWESHTWDHPYLDNLTYTEVYAEFVDNNATALQLFDNDLTNPHFNRYSVITPSITGLYNPEALRAMYDLGIRNLCGDNSHPEQLPPFPYHGWYTNVTVNGFDGMYIVPRHATNIYYDASEIAHVTDQYNFMYSTNLTFEAIMVLEVETNTRNLMQLRHDPFMFHQANMRTITYNGKSTSLLGIWVEEMVASVMKYSTLPITSHTHDDLATMLHEREARDACGFSGRLRVDHATNTIVGITASSTGTCKYAISGVSATPTDKISYETVGEEKTIWINMSPNTPVDIVFASPIKLI